MELDYFTWCKENGWRHIDDLFAYCNKPHLPPGQVKRGKKQPKSGNYYATDNNGLVIVRALVNVHNSVVHCRDCVWSLYQNERNKSRSRIEDTAETIDPYQYPAVRNRDRR